MSSKDYIEIQRQRVEEALERALSHGAPRPSVLHDAIRHAVLSGGKRIRPILALTASDAVSGSAGDPDAAMAAAVAIELLHSYTLVHDDLPAMDNDLLRRGQPTVHAKFGEAIAVLAGDALQAMAFGALAGPCPLAPEKAARLSAILSRAAIGVVHGQVEDMADAPLDEGRLAYIQAHKTADLFSAAAEMGAVAGGADDDDAGLLAKFGRELGIAFQIIDDILDAPRQGNAAEPTSCLRLWTPDHAREMAMFHTREAVATLIEIPGTPASAALSDFAESLVARVS